MTSTKRLRPSAGRQSRGGSGRQAVGAETWRAQIQAQSG